MKKLNRNILRKTICAVCETKGNYKLRFESSFKESDFNAKMFLSRKIPGKSHYKMVTCKKCGLLYSNPILKEKYIDKLYTQSTVPLHNDLINASEIYFGYMKNLLNKISKKSHILDIGCGNGFFLSRLRRSGYKNVFGVEPSKKAVKFLPNGISKKNIKIGLYKRSMFPKEAFDLICFFQVFDHLVDPNKFLRDCFYNLKKGGYVFALLHNTDSLSLKILQDRSPIIDVQHIYLFNKNNISTIFRKNGYEVEKVFTTFSRYSLSYWIKMGPFPKFIKNLFEKIS